MSKTAPTLITSEDGSHSLVSNQYGVPYHSKFGAIDESLTVFLSAGFHYQRIRGKDSIRIFEMGFGTGLNALLTMMEADNYSLKTFYHGIELYPISCEQSQALNYIDVLDAGRYREHFRQMHASPFENPIQFTPFFQFKKTDADIRQYIVTSSFDVIYYDAFAPTAQEELWTPAIMEKMYQALRPGGVLVTYCARGQFKRDLRAMGFKVEALPGPGGKREMTRAIRSS